MKKKKASDTEVRTIRIEIDPAPEQKKIIDSALRNSRRFYNLLVEQLYCMRNTGQRQRQQRNDPQYAYWQDDFLNICRPGWAAEFLKAVEGNKMCFYPKRLETYKIKQGEKKGEKILRPVVRRRDEKKTAPTGSYGIPGQSLAAIGIQFEALIKSTLSKWKKGDYKAKLPKRFKAQFPWIISSQLLKSLGRDRYRLGGKPTAVVLKLPELRRFDSICDAKFTRSRSGKYYLFVSGKYRIEKNSELTNVAAIDFGQIRAVVIAAEVNGKIETGSISGKNILALKRERDHRYRELNRKRSRILKGQMRQYLSEEEKATYRRLQEADNERQRRGRKRTGNDIKYLYQIIRKRRKEGRDGKGRSLFELDQTKVAGEYCAVYKSEPRNYALKKHSKKDWNLKQTIAKVADYYRVRLDYANHCVSRLTVEWAIKRKVGTIYVGDLNVPKGREKGKRRIKQVARNNLWEYPKQQKYIEEKLILTGSPSEKPVLEHHERQTSKTCPRCQALNKPRNRLYKCKTCDWRGDRDVVGATNLLSLVTTGSCGNLMPDSKLSSTLPVAPAIGQRIPMRGVSGSTQVLLRYDSVEASAPKSSEEICQAPTIVGGCGLDGLTETLAKQERRGEGEVSGDLRKLGTSYPKESLKPVGDSQSAKTGVQKAKKRRQRRHLKNQSETYIQLSLWDLTCDKAFGR